jgi:PAS domain S-box-containing protein
VIDQVEERNEGSAATEAIRARFAAILDAVADGITVQAPDGRVVYANAMAVRLVGFASPEELMAAPPAEIMARFELFDEAGLPVPLSALPGRRALEGLIETATTIGFRIKATGEVRWAQVGAQPLLDEHGGVVYAINTFHDISDRVRIEGRLRESEARYRQLVEAMPQIAWTADGDGRLDLLNDRWFGYTGLDRDASDTVAMDAAIHPDDREALAVSWADSLGRGQDLETQVRIRRHDGAYRWHLLRAVPLRGAEGAVVTWIGTSTDIDAAKRAEEGLRVLADAAVRLDQTLDLRETLDTAASISVPLLADWCVIDVIGPDGRFERVAVATAEPGREAVIEGLRAHPTDPAGAGPAATALRQGHPVVLGSIEDEDLVRWSRNPVHLTVLRELAPRSAMAFPLAARGRTMGTMLMVSAGSGRRFEPADVGLAEELAKRAALAISNAELYAAEQRARQDAEASAERTALLQRVTRLLADARSGTDILNVAIAEGLQAVDASAGSVSLANAEGDLVVAASHGYPDQVIAEYRVIPAASPVPIAAAFRSGQPIWIEDISKIEDAGMLAALARTGNQSVCAIPLTVEGRTVGTLGLSWRVRRAFPPADRELIMTEAGLFAQALARVSLMESRERLLADLESQRNRLEAVIQQMPGGVLIADVDGRLVTSNDHAGEIWRGNIPTDRPIAEYDGYLAYHPDGTAYAPGDWPLERALANGETVTGETMRIMRFDGTPGVIEVDAAPILDRDGAVVAAVSTFSDVSERYRNEESRRFVADATTLLASSLDYEETIRRVAELAVPGFADWCTVDLAAADGSIDRLVVAHVDPERVQLARELRERYPPDPDATRGSYAVMRAGKAELVEEITPAMVDAAPDPELRRIMRDLQLRSYLSVPLIAGGDSLGVITFVAAESGRHYTTDDLALAESLAARAASAIQNARLFRDVGRYKRILDATLDAVLMFDPETYRLAYANQGAIDQLGHDREKLLSMLATDISDDLDRPTLAAIVAPLVEGRLESRTITMTQRHASGRRVPVEVLLQHVILPGEPGRIVAIARDISDRVEAQARLQRLAESEHARAAELNAVIRAMGEGVVVCGADGTISLANPAAEELFPGIMAGGYAGIVGRLDDPEGRAPRLGSRGGPVELQIRGEDERWIELSTYPVSARTPRDGPSTAETIALFRDVTDARQRQAVRDTFIGVLSHELRTPVTTIYAGSKVLARGVSALDEDVRRSVFEDIHVEAERLHRLVEDVIALTRFGEQDSEVGDEPVLLQRLLPGVVRSEEARWPGVAFDLHLPPGVPTVGADPTYVEQVMRNLLSNAAKYGGSGSTVQTIVEASEGEVVVRILDDGPGFPADEADRLFELFFRSQSTARSVSGAGIGLFVCARLIRAMGGRIWAVQRPSGGSEFAFSLQVMRDDAI